MLDLRVLRARAFGRFQWLNLGVARGRDETVWWSQPFDVWSGGPPLMLISTYFLGT